MEGWIKLHRKFLEWEWFDDPNMIKLFIYLLLKANHANKQWRGVIIERGQLISSLLTINQQTKIGVQSIRTYLNRLKSTNEITIKSTNKYSIITICNYDIYNFNDDSTNKQTNNPTNKQLTNNQQTTNKQLTTNKNYKNYKNEKKKSMSGFLKTKIPDDRPFLKISFYFWELFRKITLEANSKTTILDTANAQEWENQVRIMLQKKEVTEDELRKIYTWLDKRKTKNAQFWAKNIKSTSTLREQIPKILEQMNSEKPEENEQSHIYKKDKVETKYPGVLKANKRDEKIKSIGELMK